MADLLDLKIDSVQLNFADNGVIVEYNGQNSNGDWCSRKEVFPSWITATERASYVWECRFDGSIFNTTDVNQ